MAGNYLREKTDYEKKIAERKSFLMEFYTKAELAYALAQFEIGRDEE